MKNSQKKITGLFLGIDPGNSGAWATIDGEANFVNCGFYHENDIPDSIRGASYAAIEQIHTSPQMGVSSAGNFMKSYGVWLGRLQGLGIKYETVLPQKWMVNVFSIFPSDKKERKEFFAKEILARYPELRPILKYKKNWDVADAMGVALYARKMSLH